MATLEELVNEVTTIKNELKTCHTNLKNNLVSKGITVSSTDKMSSLINKVANIEKEKHNLPKYYSTSGLLLSCLTSTLSGVSDIIDNKIRIMSGKNVEYINLDTGEVTKETQTISIADSYAKINDYEYASYDSSNQKIIVHNLKTQGTTQYSVSVNFAYPLVNTWQYCKNSLYIMGVYGDSDYNWSRSNNIYKFDFTTKTTTLISTKLLLSRRSCASFSTNDNEIFVLGGCLEGTTNTKQSKVEMYDIKLNTITDKGNSGTILGSHITKPLNDTVYYNNENGYLAKYDISTNTTTTLVSGLSSTHLHNDNGKVYLFKNKTIYID